MLTEIMVESSDHKYIAHIQHWILSVSKMFLFSGFYKTCSSQFCFNCRIFAKGCSVLQVFSGGFEFPGKVKPLDMVNHVIVKPIYPRRNGTSTAGDYQGGAIEHDILLI